ncbi:uncharacterized protein PpBr36_10445 [Pyricularia pennisetigena]|uniref:uncharacterized protein n=1 Tax=Pyricularia pennisetigena TaxID=1578925 RepID=UPI001153EAD0|nr:uncharacterized protein PpBr36_10445 [Pyricularia pennisetigena]TLS21281.1 hypothetical protein PpBr36_10445 [Pyricularia pennisetigena]
MPPSCQYYLTFFAISLPRSPYGTGCVPVQGGSQGKDAIWRRKVPTKCLDSVKAGHTLKTLSQPIRPPRPVVASSGDATTRNADGDDVVDKRKAVDEVNKLIKQPETRPIGQEQLVAQVKGIYAGLVMIENKCIKVVNAQNSLNNDSASPQLNTDQWQALIVLHRTLLHEHYDFFLASQHPSASPELRRLAAKYAMPARMWRHGIHSL